MYPIDFEGANTNLVKPENMTDEQCYSLPAFRGEDENGFKFTLVAFKPNYEDLRALQEGRPLYLKVLGEGFAPVALFTLDENGNANI